MPTEDQERWLEELTERLAAMRHTLEEFGEERRRIRWRADERPEAT